MKILSLFSGVGGFDLGLEAAGMETVFQCEWDKHATSVLKHRWPDVPKWGDISTLTGKHVLEHAPVIDVVAWGSPCQDLSIAGKRAGLSGAKSGLFHEGIRVIKEIQEETNGQYPRISIWENVVGALSSNKGADFGVIIDEMAEAGALVIEWAVLDAQYFGVPQRRRRVFVIAIFDPLLAGRCPDPLLPVAESLPGHLAKGKHKRKSAATTLTEGVGTDGQWAAGTSPDGDILRTSVTSKWHKGSGGPSGSEYYNMVVENQDVVGSLAARDYKGVGNQYVNENKCVVEPFVKVVRSGARLPDGTLPADVWREEQIAPTLSLFDMGDVRTVVAIVEQPVLFENSYRDGARISSNGITQTLSAKMGTNGGNTPMIAIGIQGNVIGRQDHNGPAGKGYTEEGDPMFTLTSTDIHAVAYDEYNDSTNEVHHAVATHEPILMRQREGKPGGGKGPLLSVDKSLTLAGSNDQTLFSSEPTLTVRRLTPLECERLMGWPDGHTRYKADGTEQSDTQRYKQCGNGVASPVAAWIGKHVMGI